MVDFVTTLAELRNGAAIIDATHKLTELVNAVALIGKKGKLTFEISISPSRLGPMQATEVEIEYACTIKKPERTTGRSIFYVTPEKDLVRNDPNQLGMEFQQAAEGARK